MYVTGTCKIILNNAHLEKKAMKIIFLKKHFTLTGSQRTLNNIIKNSFKIFHFQIQNRKILQIVCEIVPVVSYQLMEQIVKCILRTHIE